MKGNPFLAALSFSIRMYENIYAPERSYDDPLTFLILCLMLLAFLQHIVMVDVLLLLAWPCPRRGHVLVLAALWSGKALGCFSLQSGCLVDGVGIL